MKQKARVVEKEARDSDKKLLENFVNTATNEISLSFEGGYNRVLNELQVLYLDVDLSLTNPFKKLIFMDNEMVYDSNLIC